VRRSRFHCPNLTIGCVTLSADESRHAVDALRLKSGDLLLLFDGAGREAEGVVSRIDRRSVHVEVTAIVDRPFGLPCRITLAVAASRAHRQGFLVEKCTELGVAAFWPSIAERSVAKPEQSVVEKWSRRAVEAAKQSGRAWVPEILAPRPFAAAIARATEFDGGVLTDLGESLPRYLDVVSTMVRGTSQLVLVGPEGGWTDAERRLADEAGLQRATLGPTTLRTETAAVAVCAAAALST